MIILGLMFGPAPDRVGNPRDRRNRKVGAKVFHLDNPLFSAAYDGGSITVRPSVNTVKTAVTIGSPV